MNLFDQSSEGTDNYAYDILKDWTIAQLSRTH